jgi:hypothetical protein
MMKGLGFLNDTENSRRFLKEKGDEEEEAGDATGRK